MNLDNYPISLSAFAGVRGSNVQIRDNVIGLFTIHENRFIGSPYMVNRALGLVFDVSHRWDVSFLGSRLRRWKDKKGEVPELMACLRMMTVYYTAQKAYRYRYGSETDNGSYSIFDFCMNDRNVRLMFESVNPKLDGYSTVWHKPVTWTEVPFCIFSGYSSNLIKSVRRRNNNG